MRLWFTLIELLVVIAVIGMLASIVLVSFKGTTDKARLGKAKDFYAQVSHALGAEAVGIWKFEEGDGPTARDSSGNGNDGTLQNGPVWTSASDCGLGLGGCLEFKGSDKNNLALPANDNTRNKSAETTFAFWIKIKSFLSGGNGMAPAY